MRLSASLAAVLFVTAFFATFDAEARSGHGAVSVPLVECPFGTGTPNDGCAALFASGLQGTVQYANALTDPSLGPGSGQTYLSRLEENQAGIDFPVGVPASQGAFTDPAVSQPSGCTYNATGSGGTPAGPKLDCASTANLSLVGYEFGPVGGHGATVLRLENSLTGTVTIQNDHFENDSNTFSSSNANDYALYLGVPGSTFNLVFSHDTIDGQCFSYTCSLSNYQIVTYTTGTRYADYDAWLNQPIRMTSGCASSSCSTIGDLNLRWSFWNSMCWACTSSFHGEVIEDILSTQRSTQTTITNTNYVGDVIIEPYGASPNQTSLIYVSGGAAPNGPPIYTNTNITDSTLIANLAGPSQATASALVDFQNGLYTHVTMQNVATDDTGSGGHNFRADCDQPTFTGVIDASGILTVTAKSGGKIISDPTYGAAQLYYGGAASGISLTNQLSSTVTADATLTGVTVSGTVLSYTGITGTINAFDLVTGSGVAPGTYFVSSAGANAWNINQTTSAPSSVTANPPNGNGTYQTTSGGAVSSQTMYGYGFYAGATFPNGVTMTNVTDMTKASGSNAITSFNYKNECYVQTPP